MSKQSKNKRDLKKKRRARVASSVAHQRRVAESEQNSTLWWWVGGTVVVLALALILWFTVGPGKSSDPTATPPPTTVSDAVSEPADQTPLTMPENPLERNGMYSSPPEMQIDTTKNYRATIETNRGVIELELYPQYAPETVNNFVFLAQQGFYDNLTFHRVENNFVIQGGDPSGTGSGGPGYTLPAEIQLLHGLGAIAMARQSDEVNPERRSSGSQFYIALNKLPQLDGAYTVFGQVISGQEVVNATQIDDTIVRIEIGE